MKRTMKPIKVEERFDQSLETLWEAITNPKHMRKWFFPEIPTFEPRVGFEVEFNVETNGKSFLHQWKITRIIPYKLIEYNWKYGGYKGDSYVTFELKREKNSTILRLTHTTTEGFPYDVPEFRRESCNAGWQYFIKQQLKVYLK